MQTSEDREVQPLPERERADPGLPPGDYNYRHFRTRHLLLDVEGTIHARGVRPGEPAPDWELPRVGGGTLRLSDLRGRPTLLHFGSFT